MSWSALSRRALLRSAVAAPFLLAWGCGREDAVRSEEEEALRVLLRALGPWKEDRLGQAEDFLDRYLVSGETVAPLFARAKVARRLVDREPFRDRPLALDDLDLSTFSGDEQELLTLLVEQLYSTFEVQFVHVGGALDLGVCAGLESYTQAPPDRGVPRGPT